MREAGTGRGGDSEWCRAVVHRYVGVGCSRQQQPHARGLAIFGRREQRRAAISGGEVGGRSEAQQ
eukprot:6985467-Prymnesium_polylepis.1